VYIVEPEDEAVYYYETSMNYRTIRRHIREAITFRFINIKFNIDFVKRLRHCEL
jgi:hypothetical protein